MCDTLVAVGDATADGSVILAKNSDREPNEAQVLTHVPRTHHAPGSTVQCTYIEIPQVQETYEVILSRPFWMWGCEMGGNEWGVAIGNEAVFTREPYHKSPALTGMDLARLALERARTARQAVEIITTLLEEYGQGGNCGFKHPLYYYNSFIVADPQEAWVLETVGRLWAAEQVRDIRTISNGLTIGKRWDMASPGLVEHAIKKGWCRSTEEFDLARCYSDPLMTRLDGCRARQCRSTALLEAQQGHITVETMMAALRDHNSDDPSWRPSRGWLMETLCAHAGAGPTRPTQSVASMVAHLRPDRPVWWMTGTSAPCTGLFKPIYLNGGGLPDLGPQPGGNHNPATLWWQHERLHRAVLRDYPTRLALYRAERDALEATFLLEEAEMLAATRGKHHVDLAAFTASCFNRAAEATTRWTEIVSATPLPRSPLTRVETLAFTRAWDRFNKQANFEHV